MNLPMRMKRKHESFFFFRGGGGDESCDANCRFTQHKKNRLCTYICSLSQKAKALTTTITVFVIRYHRWEGKTEFGGGELLS